MRRKLGLCGLALLLATCGAAGAQTEEKPESQPGVTRPAVEGKEGVTRPGPGQASEGVSPAGGAKGGSAAPT